VQKWTIKIIPIAIKNNYRTKEEHMTLNGLTSHLTPISNVVECFVFITRVTRTIGRTQEYLANASGDVSLIGVVFL